MVPSLSDPRWKQLVSNPEGCKSKVSALPTKIFLGLLKVKGQKTPPEDLINEAREFFIKNEAVVKDDIAALFS